MKVAFPRRTRMLSVPITPLVDVLLILLIFFMVTSTYLDLDMIPLAEPAVQSEPGALREMPEGSDAAVRPLLVRLDGEGHVVLGGARLAGPELRAAVSRHVLGAPGAPVLVLPSPQASLQALVDLLAALAAAGASEVGVVRIDEARP